MEKQAEILDPVAEAQRVIQETQQAKLAACREEVQAVLDKYGLTLRVVVREEIIFAPKE